MSTWTILEGHDGSLLANIVVIRIDGGNIQTWRVLIQNIGTDLIELYVRVYDRE